MTILVVENEGPLAEMLQRALEAMGNDCHVASSAADADLVLESEPIDAVTLDLGMPGRSGLDWLESVADARPDLAQRTLVITGQVLGPELISRVARCGAGVLTKPFTLEALGDAVRAQIDRWSRELPPRPGESSQN